VCTKDVKVQFVSAVSDFNLRFTSGTKFRSYAVNFKVRSHCTILIFFLSNESFCGNNGNFYVEILQRHTKSVCDCGVRL
jgi:pantothenate kinase